jgi:hypothetical protein
MFYLYVNKRKKAACRNVFSIQTANVDYCFKSNYPDFLHIRMVRRPN